MNDSGKYNNIEANNLKGEKKHILKVDRGRKGYYCLSCDAEMEARKGKQRQYFAHIPNNTSIPRKCTFSNESYRHKIAREILGRIKQIRVPQVYKFPPIGIEGIAKKIFSAKTITAFSTETEIQFYESESGDVKTGKNIDFSKNNKKHLLIQPDVVFYNNLDEPILFVEIVATHGIDAEKLSKIKRLGIDTVQVNVPKDSPSKIEECFYKTSRTKWIYNYEQEITKYIRVPKGNTKGILSIDEFERKLFTTTESFKCRSSQIKSLIRGINKGLESELYTTIETRFRRDLIRVENNTERNKNKLWKLQEEIDEKLEIKFADEFDSIKSRFKKNEDRRKYLENSSRDLEIRYTTKKRKIHDLQNECGQKEQFEIERIEEEIGELEVRIQDAIEKYQGKRIGILDSIQEIGAVKARIKDERRTIEIHKEEFIRFEDSFEKKSDKEGRRIEKESIEEERRIEENLSTKFKIDERELIEEFKRRRRESVEIIKNKNCDGHTKLNRRIKEIFEGRNYIISISEGQSRIISYERAKELFDEGIWKEWYRTN